jgi:hypothetical protein
MPYTGESSGSLTLKSSGAMPAWLILKYHPEIQAQIDDVAKQGWKYLYIETRATAVTELPMGSSPYRLFPSVSPGNPYAGPQKPKNVFEVVMDQGLPEVKDIPEVLEFRINVCSKSFPRAATVDLVKGVITYLHDPFWRWEKGWEADKSKLSEAREIYEIATWLIDVKKFVLIDVFKPERYRELVETFRALPQ